MSDELWQKITQAFFRQPEVPPSEAFVTRVMARIDESGSSAAAGWKAWLVPSFGAAFAALSVFVTLTSAKVEVAAETVLEPVAETEWVFADAGQNREIVPGYALEDMR